MTGLHNIGSRDHIAPCPEAEQYSRARKAVARILRSRDPRDRDIVDRHNRTFRAMREECDPAITGRAVSTSSVHASTFMANLSVQYANEEYIGTRIMPVIGVDKLTNQFATYDKRYRLAAPSDSMEGRSKPNEINDNRSYDTYATAPYGLSNFVETKTLQNQDAPFDEMLDLQESVRELVALNEEIRIAAVVANSSNYSGNTAAVGTKWNSASGGNPIKDVLTAKAATWPGRGRGMMVGVCSLDVYNALRVNPQILEALKYTQKGGLASRENICALLELDDLLVGKSRSDGANEGQSSASYSRIWSDIFAVIRVADGPSLRNASFGYTLRFKGALNTRMWFDANVGTMGGYYSSVTLDECHKVVAGDTSYLLTAPLS